MSNQIEKVMNAVITTGEYTNRVGEKKKNYLTRWYEFKIKCRATSKSSDKFLWHQIKIEVFLF